MCCTFPVFSAEGAVRPNNAYSAWGICVNQTPTLRGRGSACLSRDYRAFGFLRKKEEEEAW